MNKRIASEIAISVILILVIMIGGIFWLQNKKVEAPVLQTTKTQSTEPIAQVQQPQVVQQVSQADEVLINRGKGLEKINILTGKISSVKDPKFDELSKYSELPKEYKNNKKSLDNSVMLVSEDKSKIIVVSNTYDQTKKPSEFDGSLPNLKSEEFTCLTEEKTCSPSNVIENANKKTQDSTYWYRWDSKNNLLYGHLGGEGVGNASPVYIYNISSGSYKKTIGYDANGEGKRAEVPDGSFSPSLKKFVMIDENVGLKDDGDAKYGEWEFLVYDSNDLSMPSKKTNVSQMQKNGTEFDRIGSVAWSKDENMLAVATEAQIFTLDLNSGDVDLKFAYPKKIDNSEWFDFNKIDFSPNGRYVTFFVSEKAKKGEKADSNGNVGVLKTIDLKNNNTVTEILRDVDVSLFY